jgi:TonB-dependent Receptor Plug Domain
MKTLLRLAAAFTALALAAPSARAQAVAVRGIVRHDTTRVAMVEVELVSVGKRTTDSAGVFSFPFVAPGMYALRVRRLGFEPYDDSIRVSSTDTAIHEIALRQLPQELPTMVVRGQVVHVPKGFEEIYRRGAHSFGYFITAEQIADRNPTQTRDLLVNVPGVVLENNSLAFQRCRGRVGSATSMEGSPQVYVDGQRMTRFARSMGDEVELALSYVEPRQIQAIEVYTGLSQIPGDFATQACAAIVIWTKHE